MIVCISLREVVKPQSYKYSEISKDELVYFLMNEVEIGRKFKITSKINPV